MSYFAVLPLSLWALGAFAMPSDTPSETEKAPGAAIKTQPEQAQLLTKARAANGDLYATLKSFVCREEIERYKGDLKGSKSRYIDHVSTNLSFENGVEHYNEVRQNTRVRASLPEINGAWSEGEFGTLLQQTGKLLELQPVQFIAFDEVSGVQAAIYRFAVAEKDSPWDLSVGPQHYKLPFTTDVWISVNSGEIVKIARRTVSIPAETRISEIAWNVTLAAVDLSGKTWLLPAMADYSVAYADSKRREWNMMSFSNYRRYASESSIRFDGFE